MSYTFCYPLMESGGSVYLDQSADIVWHGGHSFSGQISGTVAQVIRFGSYTLVSGSDYTTLGQNIYFHKEEKTAKPITECGFATWWAEDGMFTFYNGTGIRNYNIITYENEVLVCDGDVVTT